MSNECFRSGLGMRRLMHSPTLRIDDAPETPRARRSGGGAIEFIGAFESTYQPAHDVDVAETSGHADGWRADLALARACGLRRLRYPVRWHRIEAAEGTYDWSGTDEVFDHMRRSGLTPIADLVHHTSYPLWLRHGFADARFPRAFLRYVEAFARRYPW